jgi:hypothetical protein
VTTAFQDYLVRIWSVSKGISLLGLGVGFTRELVRAVLIPTFRIRPCSAYDCWIKVYLALNFFYIFLGFMECGGGAF